MRDNYIIDGEERVRWSSAWMDDYVSGEGWSDDESHMIISSETCLKT